MQYSAHMKYSAWIKLYHYKKYHAIYMPGVWGWKWNCGYSFWWVNWCLCSAGFFRVYPIRVLEWSYKSMSYETWHDSFAYICRRCEFLALIWKAKNEIYDRISKASHWLDCHLPWRHIAPIRKIVACIKLDWKTIERLKMTVRNDIKKARRNRKIREWVRELPYVIGTIACWVLIAGLLAYRGWFTY